MDLPLYRGAPIIVPQVHFRGPRAARRVDLVLDTGALSTLIPPELAWDLGLDPVGTPLRVSVVTANGVIAIPAVHVPVVELAGLQVRNVQVLCHEIPELAEANGLLGLNLLQHFITLLDYRAKKLILQPWTRPGSGRRR